MSSKIQTLAQLAADTTSRLTGGFTEWAAFLQTAARLYKYPYSEQLFIHAQRPDATACADFDVWNQRMGRAVRRGSRGIAILDTSRGAPQVKYVFDIGDTVERQNAKRPYFASRRAFEACGRAIDENVNSHFDGKYLSDGVVQDVLEKFSAERVTLVLACTVRHKEWDERFSRTNREWAKTIDTSCMGKEPYYCMAEAHPAVLDGFISMFRRQVLEKDTKSPVHENPIKHARERSDDFEL